MQMPQFDVRNPVHLAAAGVAAFFVVGYLGKKAIEAAGGIVSGDNALTQNQTNAAGEPVTAYAGAGLPGTLGAAANTASGGVLASIGQHLGAWTFDIFGPKVDINAPQSKIDKVQ